MGGVPSGVLRTQGELDREPEALGRRVGRGWQRLQQLQQARPVVPRRARRPIDDVVAQQGRHRQRDGPIQPELSGHSRHLVGDRGVARRVEVHQVDLVDRDDDVGDAQQRGHREVAPGLFQHPLADVDQQHQRIGGARARDRVAGVLHVPGAVGQDEGPVGGGEVAVGDVDGDPLLALGPQAIGEQRQIHVPQPLGLTRAGDRVQLVGEHRLGVVQQPAHQGGLAVIDRPGGGQPQQGSALAGRARRDHGRGCSTHQKYPSFLRSSMAASVSRSSARVAPRSVIRVAATSSSTSATSAASDSTAPVQDMSPTVR